MTVDLAALLRAGAAFIDLRSPGEYAAGAVPGAVNLPLLTDQERARIGLTYRESGQAAAIALGEELVSGSVREQRLMQWQEFVLTRPDAWLYCWRGGLRSQIAQVWLANAGVEVPKVAGGFKALRHVCLDTLAAAPGEKDWYVLAGRTGSGKTELLRGVSWSIDLEGLANHRGSAFGARHSAQPPPVGFENALAVAFLRHGDPRLLLEDESRTIGRLAVPPAWHERMQKSPLLILEVDLDTRCENIRREYVDGALAHGASVESLSARYQSAVQRIRRRLGGQRTAEVAAAVRRGFEHGDHIGWISRLLEWYYDPMYDFQLEKKQGRVLVQGSRTDLESLIEELPATSCRG